MRNDEKGIQGMIKYFNTAYSSRENLSFNFLIRTLHFRYCCVNLTFLVFFKAYRIRPELDCEAPVKNSAVCLDKLGQGKTDLAMIDIGDLVTGHT
jgi:hypothetical protein